ncbi:hypothetical protein GCM10009678_20440 [Actinomadura kijaniata]|uniref:Uncharacterized protein n=1 Tax=Actinomadura namibiensis TaxID=182080 RepID=A0A7W3LJ09_ACTNM|nr:hypothetical protein [Actinomadura namibiensis]MBA8949026.1 hypothetical protein [Actinomadura namibiensis]
MTTDHDEPGPVFDEDFVRGATIREPSASERVRTPGRVERWRMRREWRRRKRASARERRAAERPGGASRADVLKLVLVVLALLAISTGLWWVNRPEPAPVVPVVPQVPKNEQQQPPPGQLPGRPPGQPSDEAPEPVPTRAAGQAGLTFRVA